MTILTSHHPKSLAVATMTHIDTDMIGQPKAVKHKHKVLTMANFMLRFH